MSSRLLRVSVVLVSVMVVEMIVRFVLCQYPSTDDWTFTTEGSSTSSILPKGSLPILWRNHTSKIYGHIHMAKTAGSEINGELAAKFERVCGNKGYSYDAYQLNVKAKRWKEEHPNQRMTPHVIQDTMTRIQKKHNRGRVPPKVMDEIGYEDCDWISRETGFGFWPRLATRFAPFEFEIHVPCRDPVDWLMSMLNHVKENGNNPQLSFSCNDTTTASSIKQEVDKCLLMMERFQDREPTSLPSNMKLKCYNAIPIEPYVRHMERILQPKRFVTSYVHRDTNLSRNKTAECIYSNSNQALKANVETYLVEHVPVFRFCKRCIGSKDDLLFAHHH